MTRQKHRTSMSSVDVMMVLAKRIYILIIKVNKLFSFFLSWCFLKEIENMFSVFLSSYRNIRESLGELEKSCGNTRLRPVYPQHFSFTQTSTLVSITQQKHGTYFLFLKYHFLPYNKLDTFTLKDIHRNLKFKKKGVILTHTYF